ncbi:MAG: altronate dehydratase family protein [Phycisphaerae bacterium]
MAQYAFNDVLILLNPLDSVAGAKRVLHPGDVIVQVPAGAGVAGRVEVSAVIPVAHKLALRGIAADEAIIKYGQTIGFATTSILPGQHVHSHNVYLKDYARDYAYGSDVRQLPPPPTDGPQSFQGYARADGRVGTRNYIAIVASVNCSASVTNYVRDRFRTPEFRRDFPNVDGVIAFTHKSGCCVQPGEPMEMLQRTLAGIARHPNIFGYVMVGLGCETNQIPVMVESHRLKVLQNNEPSPAFMTIQDLGGIAKTVEAGVVAVRELAKLANQAQRTTQPLSKLTLAMNCGGSDGASGITANPALGVASDLLVRHGGTSVLAETTEIYGAEHLLTRRAVTRAVGEKLVERIRWWEAHVRLHNATIDNNPTYGNKEGGLTTIYEKSLGAVAKAGVAPLQDVLLYAQRITRPGLNFMDTPGLDPVSMTGLVAGGCNICCFTTGRGSVYGCKPAPSLKIATNTRLYEHMRDDMDMNAGMILDAGGGETVDTLGHKIFAELVALASGKPSKSEAQGIGDEEFAPWILGPTF